MAKNCSIAEVTFKNDFGSIIYFTHESNQRRYSLLLFYVVCDLFSLQITLFFLFQ